MHNEHMSRVKEAFLATKLGALLATLDMRNPGPLSSGSTFKYPQDIFSLMDSGWQPYDHPSITAPAVGFKANIPGNLGIISLDELIEKHGHFIRLVLLDGHKSEKNPEGCGFVEASLPFTSKWYHRPEVHHTTLLLGPNTSYSKCDNISVHERDLPIPCSECDGSGFIKKEVETVWTFFPGDPVLPSRVKDDGLHRKEVTTAEAREMGFKIIKLGQMP